MPGSPGETIDEGLLTAAGESGICRVVCFSPRHDLTLGRMPVGEIRQVVDLWAAERAELARRDDIAYVQIFENRGAAMGASNPHPHGQIWASSSIPSEVIKEQTRQRAHFERVGQDLLGDYLRVELDDGSRLVCQNRSLVALVPFWAVWPFETMILPRRRVETIDDFTGTERDDLADIIKQLLTRCDHLFDAAFPYSMGFHERPADAEPHPEWRWHAHVYPPLLRSTSVRKFMVGYEMLASAQRDIPPEEAAARLRANVVAMAKVLQP
jgi:UDPglucose--hexose-1-phosphate uridylyltransferase